MINSTQRRKSGPEIIWQEELAKCMKKQIAKGMSFDQAFTSISLLTPLMKECGEITKKDLKRWMERQQSGYYDWIADKEKRERSYLKGNRSYKAFIEQKCMPKPLPTDAGISFTKEDASDKILGKLDQIIEQNKLILSKLAEQVK